MNSGTCTVQWVMYYPQCAQNVLLIVRNSLAQCPEISSAATANMGKKQNKQPAE